MQKWVYYKVVEKQAGSSKMGYNSLGIGFSSWERKKTWAFDIYNENYIVQMIFGP